MYVYFLLYNLSRLSSGKIFFANLEIHKNFVLSYKLIKIGLCVPWTESYSIGDKSLKLKHLGCVRFLYKVTLKIIIHGNKHKMKLISLQCTVSLTLHNGYCELKCLQYK